MNKIRLLIILSIVMLTPLTREVLAVSEGGLVADDNISEGVGTSEIVPETIPQVMEKWYSSEQIFGDIDIGDFVVSPGKAEIEVKPGETVVKEITITNRIKDGTTFKLEIEDMEGTADGSQALVLTGKTDSPYSINSFISFPQNEVTLALGERAKLPITITVPPSVSPGGYYGSILVSTVRIDDEQKTATPIVARVGSLFFITVPGAVDRAGKALELSTLDQKWWYEKGPINLAILYENTGSIHLNPYGELEVKNMFGQQVGFLELDPWFVLPKSLRSRELSWDREMLLGRYTVTAQINRGYDDIVDEIEVSFWVLPWKIITGSFVVLFIVIFGIRAFLKTFEFKRKSG